MALSVVDLYRDVLPRTNCGECGFPTCLAFASMVVSEKHPLSDCPHLTPDVVARCNQELRVQYAANQWTKRDMAEDALKWAIQRASSMNPADLPERIGGTVIDHDGKSVLNLPYFNSRIMIASDDITHTDGVPLSRWEKVFIYNHIAQGGRRAPTGTWKGFEEFPNTLSKIKTMAKVVEAPLVDRFQGRIGELMAAAVRFGGRKPADGSSDADVVFIFQPLPRVPVLLMFWDEDPQDGFGAAVKLLFDETATEHLDIESIVFLSEHLRKMLCDAADTCG